MITLAFAAPTLRRLKAELWNETQESAAILLCIPMRLGSADSWRLLVREVHIVPPEEYLERSSTSVRVSASFCLPLEKRARTNSWSLVYVHTHPKQEVISFSEIDDRAEDAIDAYVRKRIPGVPHLALLFTQAQAIAREMGTQAPVKIIEVGEDLLVASDPGEPFLEERFDRQIRAFGQDGQARIARLTVGVVGLGGTGSMVVQELAYLGVRRFVLVDNDTIEPTNLNRVVGATPKDIGEQKVAVAERLIRSLHPDAEVTQLVSDVTHKGIGRKVAEADFIFSCTDTHSSRHLLNQMAYQYTVPLIDMGVSITLVGDGKPKLAGHVKMLAPTLPCLWCARHIDSDHVRRELMTAEHRAADPYFQGGAGVEQPAVISLNGVVVSVAITMFLAATAGVPSSPRYVIYDGNRARMNAVTVDAESDCNFCGPNSTSGWGDTFPLPERKNV